MSRSAFTEPTWTSIALVISQARPARSPESASVVGANQVLYTHANVAFPDVSRDGRQTGDHSAVKVARRCGLGVGRAQKKTFSAGSPLTHLLRA